MKKSVMLFIMLAACMIVPPSLAGAGTTEPVLEQVLVTATRTETSEREVASSVTVITSDELEKKQIQEVKDALREVPALDVVQNGGPGATTRIFMRGAKSEHTLVIIDGIEINDPSSTGRGVDLANLTSDNIERIEIVRGPQSVLYGSDAIGGVINIITKKGKEPEASVRAEGGTFGTAAVGAAASGSRDKLHFSLGGSYYHTDGISMATDEVSVNSEKDRYINRTLSGRVGFAGLKDVLDLDIIGRYSRSDVDIDDGTGRDPDVVNDDPDRIFEAERSFLRTQLGLHLFDNMWEQRLAFNYSKQDRDDTDKLDPKSNGPFDFEPSSTFFEGVSKKAEWQHILYLNENNTLTAGFEYEEEKFDSTYSSQKDADTRSCYLQDQFSIGDSFFLAAGVRLDDHEQFGEETTWRVAPAVLVDRTGTKFKGSYGTGFKAPSLFQLFSSYGNPELYAEESKGWDMGVEQSLLDGRLNIGLTYFQNDFTDLIDYDFALWTYSNIGEAKSRGLECSLRADLTDEFSVSASYTYTDTEDEETGERLLRRPLHKANLTAGYSFLDRGYVSATLLYVGARDDKFYPSSGAPRIVELDDYTLVNMTAQYDISKNLRLFGRIENLFDEEYEEVYGFGTPGVAGYAGIKIMFR